MQSRYKIILSSKNLYKEIELSETTLEVKVGTGLDCDIRLHKDLFFEPIELFFVNKDGSWSILCSDNLYLSVGDVRKLITKSLEHGDSLEIRYQNSGNLIFNLDFYIDFDDGSQKYERCIDISSLTRLCIGSDASCQIQLKSEFVKNDKLEFTMKGEAYELSNEQTNYGVYINGKKAIVGDKLQDGDFFSVGDFFFFYKDGNIWTEVRDDMCVNGLSFLNKVENISYPMFRRNTRIKTIVNTNGIEILDPPSRPQKPKDNLFTKLLPSMGMLLAAGVMMFMGGSMVIMAFISAGMAIFTSIVTMIESKKEYKLSIEHRYEQYNKYIDQKRAEIEQAREQEIEDLERIYISQEKEKENFEQFSPNLFDRTIEDNDFLLIRLGNGKVEAKQEIKYKKQERLEVEDELQLMPETLCNEYRYLDNAPVVCDMKDINALGIIGTKEDRFGIFKNIVLDIIARHYFADVRMVFVAEPKNAEKIKWLRMLPNVETEGGNIKTLVIDDESKNTVFEYLYKELNMRKQQKEYTNRIIVFFYDEFGFKSHPISRYVKNAKELGFTFVFFGDVLADIPLGCEKLIDLKSSTHGVLSYTNDSRKEIDFEYSAIETEIAKNIVDMVAPVYVEEISLEGTLTKSISMFELLNIMSVEDLNLEERWENSQVYKSMAAPIGVSKAGIVALDLHDKAHGPHGLVAGTTGSGKSEILQTYILSAATLFHPYEIGFVIIDFKGGGMVNQFKNLPHLMGAITNIDGREIERSLKSIKAELQKRQKLFAEAEVNHIDKYIMKYKSGDVTVPLPHLVLIVDEFAELKAEQPEFMKELISAARIGRSLGVHLILATQKPSGQVNEQIWSNSKFKLCLKVQSQEDSNEVIKSPLAAEIKEPGRAYLQVGNNEIFELFQSAYSGAPEKMGDITTKSFSINRVSICGKRTEIYSQKPQKVDGIVATQLDALVDYIDMYTKQKSIDRLKSICLPPLEKMISPNEATILDEKYSIGIYDDPDTQYQGNVWFDFDNENTFIIGASQTGKTNLLQLIIKQIVTNKKADESTFYILDFGSMILKNFETLNHVGGVVIPSEEEKIKNLFKLFMQEIEYRKEKLLKVGVGSIAAYNEAGYKDIPHMYLMLDNFAIFKELFAEKYEDDFLFLAREGITYGISIIVTANSSNGFGYKYMSNFSNHIALSCNDNAEYSNMFERCRMEPLNTPGRMLLSINKVIYEAQSFISFAGEKEIDRITAIKKFVEEINSKNIGLMAKKIPEVPDVLDMKYIMSNFSIDVSRYISVALNYQYVEPVMFDIYETPQLAIVGKLTENMVLFEKALINEVKQNYFERTTNLYIIDSLSRDLAGYAEEPFVETYTLDYSNLGTMFEKIVDELEERMNDVMEDGLEVLKTKPLIMLMINNNNAYEFISNSKEIMSMYTNIVTKYKTMKVMIVFGGISDENIGYSSCDLLKKIKENKHAFIFSNLVEHKVFDIPAQFIRQNKKSPDPTQGYYLKESEIVKLRFAKEE